MKKLLICIILLCTSTFIAHAGNTKSEVLTIKNAVALAVDNSEELKIGQQKLYKMNNTYKEVRASAFPQIGGDVGLDRYIESPVLKVNFDEDEVKIPIKQEWDSRVSITVSQVLWSFGKVFNAIKIAKRVIDLERLSIEATKNELGYGVKTAYYTMLLAQKTTKIAERSYENALKNKVALKTRFKSGRISMVNNVKMEADVAGRIPPVMRARSSLDQATIALKDLLGLKKESNVILTNNFTTDFPEYDFRQVRVQMLTKDPIVTILRNRIDLNELVVKHRKYQFYPILTGFATYNYTGTSGKIFYTDDMSKEIITGLRFNFSLWDGGLRLNAHRKALNDKNIAEIEYQKKINELEVELKSTLSKYNALIETYKACINASKFAEESYKVILSSFKSGVVSQTMLNDVDLQLTAAKLNTLSSLYEINLLMAKIDKLIAQGNKL